MGQAITAGAYEGRRAHHGKAPRRHPRLLAQPSSAWTFDSRISNGLIEGINSLVQAAKAKARGYRNRETLKAVTYMVAGKLDLKLPT